jgi:hypothetical protein
VLTRWLGLTLVILLLLQLAVLLPAADWQDEGFRQILMDRLVSQAPMAFIGLLLMLVGSRLAEPQRIRTPLRWVVCVLSALLTALMIAAIPLAVSGNQSLADQADQTIEEQRSRLESARQQAQNPEAIRMLGQQLAQAGQLPAGASEAEQEEAARAFVDRQLDQMQSQLEQAQKARNLAVSQRRYGGTGTAVVLAVSFLLLALAAVI